MTIEAIFDTIQLIANKKRRGFIKTGDLQLYVQAAIRDLHNELLDEFRAGGKLPDKLRPFRTTSAVSFTSGSATLPTDFADVVSFQGTVSGEDYEAKVARTDLEWVQRNKTNLFKDARIFAPDHWFKKEGTIALTGGVGSLPSDYVDNLGVFTASGEEGNIVSEEEYHELVKSKICAPTTAEPIGRIRSNQVEVNPSSIASINITYYAFPTQYVPLVRTTGANVEILPVSVASGKLHYIKTPTEIVYNTTTDVDGRGVTFTSTGSTDTEFEENAINDIVAKALIYLGMTLQAPELAQFELLKNGAVANGNNPQ